nr:T9SS type A sorting domain-containing protein [candidate division Zixibacteria bacterium]
MRFIILTIMICCIAVSLVAAPPVNMRGEYRTMKPALTDKAVFFDANQLLMFVGNTGSIAMDRDQLFGRYEGFYYPFSGDTSQITDGSLNKVVMYAAGLILCGKVNGEIRTAVAAYEYPEFVPGPMSGGTFIPDEESFRVYQIDSESSPGDYDYDHWPADQGAPVDADGKSLLLGDQTLWAVYNDADPAGHDNYYGGGTLPLGIEIRQTVWGSDNPDEENILYLKYRLDNRGDHPIDSFYIVFWGDPDLGGANDDRIGCDTGHNMFYCYNGADYDLYYGDIPPAWGGKVVSGPVVSSPGDTAVFDGNPLPDYKNIGMTSFTGYINGTEPDEPQELFLYARGRDGYNDTPLINPETGDTTVFMAPGNPLRNQGWTDKFSADKRILVGFGPLTFNPGDSQQVAIKIGVYAERDRLFSLSVLRHLLDSTIAIDSVIDTVTYIPADSVRLVILDYGLEAVRFSPLKERWLTGYDWGGDYFYGGADYGSEFFGSSINPTANPKSFSSVEIRFSWSNCQQAYRYERTGYPASPYPCRGYWTVPFTVWDIDNSRQLNAAFVEDPFSNVYDMIWDPDSLINQGGNEIIFIFSSDYHGLYASHDGPIDYTTMDLLNNADSLDVMFMLWPAMLDGSDINSLDDGQKLSFTGQFINPSGFLDTLYFRERNMGESDEQGFTVQSFSDGPNIIALQTSDPAAFVISSPLLRFTEHINQRTSVVFRPYRPGLYDERMYVIDSASGELLHTIILSASSPNPTAVDEPDGLLPGEYFLAPNFPNPFNPSTEVFYFLARRSQVEITIYNLLGQRVKTLINGDQSAGEHAIIWDGMNEHGEHVASGIYFCRFMAGDFVQTRKMVLVK